MILEKFDSNGNFNRLGPRRGAFRFIVNYLSKLEEQFCIVETGTARARDNWEGDGQSTLIWDWFIKESGLKCDAFSVDISKENCYASSSQVGNVNVVCSDSVIFLNKFTKKKEIKLLFLDSWDWTQEGNLSSAFHHLAELCTVFSSLPRGCLVAVDDCHGENQGKHWLVEDFFLKMGIMPSYNGYISVWKKL